MNDLPEQVAVQSAKQMRELMKRKNETIPVLARNTSLPTCSAAMRNSINNTLQFHSQKNGKIVYLLFLEISCEENCGTMRHCSDCRGGISALSRFIRICFVVKLSFAS